MKCSEVQRVLEFSQSVKNFTEDDDKNVGISAGVRLVADSIRQEASRSGAFHLHRMKRLMRESGFQIFSR